MAVSQAAQRIWFLLLLSTSHAVVDLCTGAVVALLPILRDQYALNYTLIGNIILVAQLTSSLTQPIFGVVSDRSQRRWLLILAPLVAGLGLAAMGLTPSYWLMLAAVVFSSLGTAAFHPEGAHAAHNLAGERRVGAMSIYSAGGNIGYALAPLYASALIALTGSISGITGAVLIPLALSLLVWRLLPSLKQMEARHAVHLSRPRAELPQTSWYGLAVLTLFTMLRSMIQTGIITFLPFYWIDVLGHARSSGPYVLFFYLMAGVAGTLLGAPLADRIGNKRLILISFASLIVFQALILYLKSWLLLVALAGAGFLVVATSTVTLVMSQDYAPRQLGLASGLNLGLAFGFGGLGATLLGMVADRYGVVAVLWCVAGLTPVALLIAALLPPKPAAALPTAAR